MSGTDSQSLLPRSATEPNGPRFFYGWVMVPIAMAGIICSAPAQTFGVSPFNPYFRDALNITETQLTGAYMLGTFLASLPMRYVGAAMDRYGIRKTKTVVILLFGLACVLTSQVTGLVTLFLAFFALRLLGQGSLGVLLSGSTLAFWFERKLGRVESLRNLGVAGSIAFVPAVTLWLIQAVGWRWAYAILGMAVCAIMLPLMLLFRNRPEDIGQRKDGLAAAPVVHGENGDAQNTSAHETSPAMERDFTPAEARHTRAFWLAMFPMAAWALTNTGVMFVALPLFEQRGVAEGIVPWLFTMFAIGLAGMILVGGYLADRMPLNVLLALATTGMALSWTMVRLMGSIDAPWMIFPCGVVMGLTQGTLMSTMAPFWPRYYGRVHLGKLKGTLATVMVAASSAGPFVMGASNDWLGSYNPILTVFAIATVPMAIGALWATRPDYPPHWAPAGRCTHCGYDLRGLAAGDRHCSECGAVVY